MGLAEPLQGNGYHMLAAIANGTVAVTAQLAVLHFDAGFGVAPVAAAHFGVGSIAPDVQRANPLLALVGLPAVERGGASHGTDIGQGEIRHRDHTRGWASTSAPPLPG